MDQFLILSSYLSPISPRGLPAAVPSPGFLHLDCFSETQLSRVVGLLLFQLSDLGRCVTFLQRR